MAIQTTARKTGRPHGFYRAAEGTRYDGLTRRADGRWRISATGQFFTEPDEARAIRYFLEQTGQSVPTIRIVGEAVLVPTIEAGIQRTQSLRPISKPRRGRPGAPVGPVTQVMVRRENGFEQRTMTTVDESAFWARVTQELSTPEGRTRAARKTGYAALAWLEDLQKPTTGTKLAGIVDHYAKKPGLSHDESVRAKKQWEEFCAATKATTLKDLTHAAVARYEQRIAGEGLSAKSVKHRYAKVKTIIAYAMKRGVSHAECRAALDVLAMLEVPDASPLAPHPIRVDYFWALYAAAKRAGDPSFAALLLTAANCCMYPSEVAALKWAEINLTTGEVVTARRKTKVARVAVLWPETIAALQALPRERDFVFFSCRRSYTTNLVSRHFAGYRDAAKLADDSKLPESVKFGDLRDFAYTHACRAVSLDKAKILAGHRLPGATDHYVQRNPGFVSKACAAVGRALGVTVNVARIDKDLAEKRQ